MTQRIRKGVEKILAAETGTVVKDAGGRVNVVLAFPSSYRAAMSNLGFQGIYGFLNSMPDVACERVVMPDAGDLAEYDRTRTRLMSLESGRPLHEFHVVAFSVSYEIDYPNVVRMLRLAGLEPRAKDRNDDAPLVILGGICTAYNPEPLADFFDVIFIGEAEASLPRFLRLIGQEGGRDELLRRLSGERGVYIPSLYREEYRDGWFEAKHPLSPAPSIVRRGAPADLDSPPWLTTTIHTTETEFSGMGLIEVMRGCPWSCRFCVAGQSYRPVRYRSEKILDRLIGEASTRFSRIGLVGPSVSDARGIERFIARENVSFSVSSLRAGERTRELVPLLARRGQRSLSIAPEAATDRLRRVINKRLTEDDILTSAAAILGAGVPQLRLYFMVGLPTETDDDISAIGDLVRRIRGETRAGQISLTVSPFVPKPLTAFQWMPMARLQEIREKIRMVRRDVKGLKGVTVSHDPSRSSLLEGFLARADRRASRVCEAIASGRSDWQQAAAEVGMDCDAMLHEVWAYERPLPWGFIDPGFDVSRLEAESREALTGGQGRWAPGR